MRTWLGTDFAVNCSNCHLVIIFSTLELCSLNRSLEEYIVIESRPPPPKEMDDGSDSELEGGEGERKENRVRRDREGS